MNKSALTLSMTLGLLVGQTAIGVEGLPSNSVTAAERAVDHGLGLLENPCSEPSSTQEETEASQEELPQSCTSAAEVEAQLSSQRN